jgi:hypothetical protein
MVLASAWYSPNSSQLWADIIAIAGIVATVIVGRQALPKRRIGCTLISRSRLMDTPQSMRGSLKVSYEDKTLKNPYIIACEIASTGRSAIPSTSFDQDRSLQLNLGVEILAVLSVDHEPASAAKPALQALGCILELRPELIARREIIKTSLLTEGSPDIFITAFDPFGDVKIEVKDREVTQARWRMVSARLPLVCLSATIALAVAFYYNFNSSNNDMSSFVHSAFCLNTDTLAQSTDLAMQLVYRDIEVHHLTASGLASIKVASSYGSDVQAFNEQAGLLISSYTSFNSGKTAHISLAIKRGIVVSRRVPRESGAVVLRDVAYLGTLLNDLSNPDVTVPISSCGS